MTFIEIHHDNRVSWIGRRISLDDALAQLNIAGFHEDEVQLSPYRIGWHVIVLTLDNVPIA